MKIHIFKKSSTNEDSRNCGLFPFYVKYFIFQRDPQQLETLSKLYFVAAYVKTDIWRVWTRPIASLP